MSFIFVWLQSLGFYGTIALVAVLYLTKTAPIDMLRSVLALSGVEQIVSLCLVAAPALFLISLLLRKAYGSIVNRHVLRKREEFDIEPISIRELVDSGMLPKSALLPSFLTFPFRFLDAILTAKKYDWDNGLLSDRIWYWVEVVEDVLGGLSIWGLIAYATFTLIR